MFVFLYNAEKHDGKTWRLYVQVRIRTSTPLPALLKSRLIYKKEECEHTG